MAHRFAPEAETEIEDIWRYIAQESGSFDIADRLIDTLTERFFLLSRYPHIGRHRDDLRSGLRSFPVGEYIIIYRVDGKDVLILHVFRGNRDIETLSAQ